MSLMIVVMLALCVAACADPTAGKTGADLYRATCAHCHGASLSGGIGPRLDAGSNAATTLRDDQISGAIRVGPGSMPGYGARLTDEQIRSLVVYLRSVQADPASG